MIGLGVLLITVVLGAWQFSIMQASKIETDTFKTQASTLSLEKENLINDYQEIRSDVSKARETAAQELAFVFPTDEGLTDLTRLFDDFATKNNFETNPFFITSINYQTEKDAEGYRYVPVSLNVEASSKNLSKFLEFLETSGSLESEIRLMSIEDMNISYPAEYGGTYSARFTINAYFSQDITITDE